MKKITNFFKATACIICFTVLMNSVNAQSWPPSSISGSGTAGDPWKITSIRELTRLATYVNAGNGSQTAGKYYMLMNDIAFDYSIEVPKGKSEFFIYPNPTSSHITISSEKDFHTLEIMDLLGRVVYTQVNNGNNTTLNVSGYGNGIYFIRITTENGLEIKKFVKK